MLTIEWQPLTPRHGYVLPEAVVEAGLIGRWEEAMDRSKRLHDDIADRFPHEASYAVSLAYRVRYSMQLNAREAIHMLELRTGPQGHPSYRRVCQEMHRLIGEKAGHHALAAMMSHVDHSEPELERLESERRAEQKRNT
jgi:thymidylate synthase ThyX